MIFSEQPNSFIRLDSFQNSASAHGNLTNFGEKAGFLWRLRLPCHPSSTADRPLINMENRDREITSLLHVLFNYKHQGVWASCQLMPQTLANLWLSKANSCISFASRDKWWKASRGAHLNFISECYLKSFKSQLCLFKVGLQLKCKSVNQRSDQNRTAPSFLFWELITQWWCVTVIFLWSLNLEAVLPESFGISSCWHLQIYYLSPSPVFTAHEVNALFFYQLCFVFLFSPEVTSAFSLM